MNQDTSTLRDGARVLLAGIRFVNGAVGLFAPALIIGRFGSDPGVNPVAHYALRLFGVRTILIAIDLVRPDGRARDHAIRVAPIIHASDTVAAILASRSGGVPGRTGTTIVLISALNTLLALLMQTRR